MTVETTKRGKPCWLGKVQVDHIVKTKVCKTREEAKAWEDMMKANAEWAHPKAKTTILTVLGWVNHYLDAMKDRKIAESTLCEKVTAFETLLAKGSPITRDMAVTDITVGHADLCLRARMRTGSGYAANKARKNLSAAWSWGLKHLDMPPKNPFGAVDKFKEERKPRSVPPVEHFWKVYRVATTPQDKLMLLAYLDTAARRTELFNLKWRDVDLGEGRICLYTRKRLDGTLEGDWIKMSSRLRIRMREHAQWRTSEVVFPDPSTGGPYKHRQHWIMELCGIAGVPRFDLHSVRHLSASLMAKAGLSLPEIQLMLRHKSATTTNRYLHQLGGVAVPVDSVFREGDLPVIEHNKTPGDFGSGGPAVSSNGFREGGNMFAAP